MNKRTVFRAMMAGLLAGVLLCTAGCNPDEKPIEENSKGEQLSQGEAEIGTEGSGNVSAPSGTVGNQGSGTSSGSDSFEEDPDQAVSSDGTSSSPQQPDGNQQVDGSMGEGGASEDGFMGEGGGESGNEGSTPSYEGTGEIVPSEPSSGESEPIVYDEALAKEYEEYLAMDMTRQAAFHETFKSPSAFREWREAAQAAYDAKQAANTVNGGSLNLHDYVKGKS